MRSPNAAESLDLTLDCFDSGKRTGALQQLAAEPLAPAPESVVHNLHCHTFYSYNGYGYSPSHIAWLAKNNHWFAAGIVDFDVLDAVDEFHRAAELLDLRHTAGMESRVFFNELSDKEINSPGEPGVAYHLGLGFTSGAVPDSQREFARYLRDSANARTCKIIQAVNDHLTPVTIDFAQDAVPLTPGGNVTERHVCQAYRQKAEQHYPNLTERAEFWSKKLGISLKQSEELQNDPVSLEAQIRARTMKQGGVGYIKPHIGTFPPMGAFNLFIKACGAIPTIAWLNGLSAGEADIDRLLELHITKGAAMVNIIPDRNWNVSSPEKQKQLIGELQRLIASCKRHNLPIVVGTEMNAPGQKLIDDFMTPALYPYIQDFVDGAAILSAHTQLSKIGRGYLSDWAMVKFSSLADKNRFFAEFGKRATPHRFETVSKWAESPQEMLKQL